MIYRKLNKVATCSDKLDKAIKELEKLLQEVCEFESAISILPDDGICILNQETMNVTPIRWFDLTKPITEKMHEERSI